MPRGRPLASMLLVAGLAVGISFAFAQENKQAEREAMYYRYMEFASYVKGGSIQPHWMADGSSFWYAEGAPANTVIWKVDPKANTKAPLFDTARLRQALTPLLGHGPEGSGVPFREFEFLGGEKAARFRLGAARRASRMGKFPAACSCRSSARAAGIWRLRDVRVRRLRRRCRNKHPPRGPGPTNLSPAAE